MLTAVIHLQTLLPMAEGAEAVKDGPGPILPELKELAWSFGSFVFFLIAMRLYLVPQLKKGMDARYGSIRNKHEQADAARASAKADVVEYERQLAAVKAEAAARVDAARQTVEAERHERISALNAVLAEQRAAATAENEAATAAVRDQIHSAVADVAARAGELATGRRPDGAVVSRVVSEVMAR